MSQEKIIVHATILADRQKVWDYYTKPEHIIKWNFAAVYTEVNPGSDFTYEFGGRFSTVTFIEDDGCTVLVVAFDPETENPIELQRNGWQAILNNFKNYTELN